MVLWKTSIGGIKYYLTRLPGTQFYNSSSMPASALEARAEVALGTSILLQNQAVLYGIWSGVKNIESQVARRFRGATGVLIVAIVAEADITNPDVGIPQRMYKSAFIGGAGNNYNSVVSMYEATPSLVEGSGAGWRNTYAYVWATKT